MELVNKTTEKEYKEFLEKHERCHFQQSIEWAKIKSNWKKWKLGEEGYPIFE